MIIYTKEEIEDFLNMNTAYARDIKTLSFVYLTINSKVLLYDKDDIRSILKTAEAAENSITRRRDFKNLFSYGKFTSMVHKVSFDRLPLFMGSYPEITSFRLKVGK